MQSVIQKKSYGSVKTFWLDKPLLNQRIRQSAKNLKSEKKEVEDVFLFGSLVEDKVTVLSDVDILIIVKDSKKRFIDRYIEYIDYFNKVGLNVDLMVYTRQEVEKGVPLVEQVLSKGVKL